MVSWQSVAVVRLKLKLHRLKPDGIFGISLVLIHDTNFPLKAELRTFRTVSAMGAKRFDYGVINYITGLADSFEINLVLTDLDHHEVVVAIEAGCAKRTVFVDTGAFARGSRDKVLDSLLWHSPFVNVIVT